MLVPPTTPSATNRVVLEKAEAIRCLRVTSLINEKFGFLDNDKMRRDFLACFKKMYRKKYEKRDTVYRHLSNFAGVIANGAGRLGKRARKQRSCDF